MNMNDLTVTPRRPTTTLKKSTKKDVRLSEIYYLAAQLIHERGYDATSLQDIAKAVGLAKAGLYHYVATKEQLLFGVMNYAMDRVQTDVIEPASGVKDLAERMRQIIERYAHLIIDDGQAITLVINEATGLTTAHQRKITARRRAFYDFVRATVSQLKEQGLAPVLDVSVTALSLFGVMMWLAHWYQPDGRLTREQVVAEITELTVNRMLGLKQPANSKGRKGRNGRKGKSKNVGKE